MKKGWSKFGLGLVQLALCVLFVAWQQQWCKWIPGQLDMCWVFNASFEELKIGFPRFYLIVYLGNLILDYGLLAISGFVAYRNIGKISWGNILLMGLSLIFALSISELGLRILGWEPGQFRQNKWITNVTELTDIKGFYGDANGVFKVDTALIADFKSEVEDSFLRLGFLGFEVRGTKYSPEVGRIYYDHLHDIDGENSNSELIQKIEKLQNDGSQSAFDSLLLTYFLNPINAHGFYSVPFTANQSDRVKVLLLGDSFTWGHTTTHKTRSFSNTLLARDYLVYNTGISGADVPQYRKILELYTDSLKPDVVVLNFYMGNDVSYFKRDLKAHLPIHFPTNAGNLIAFQDGVQFHSKEDAYWNIMRNMRIPQTSNINQACSKTVVSTLFWQGLVKLGMVDHEYFIAPARPEIPYCNTDMKWIQDYCISRDIHFILSVIPNLVDGELDGVETVPNLFDSIPYYQPNMTLSQFSINDGHFNDAGHLFYANYLEELITEVIENKQSQGQ